MLTRTVHRSLTRSSSKAPLIVHPSVTTYARRTFVQPTNVDRAKVVDTPSQHKLGDSEHFAPSSGHYHSFPSEVLITKIQG